VNKLKIQSHAVLSSLRQHEDEMAREAERVARVPGELRNRNQKEVYILFSGEQHGTKEDDSMLRATAKVLKRCAPTLHEFLKRAFRRSKLPAVKLLNGRFTLVAPNLISARPTEMHVLMWIRQLLRPGGIFFDVGAHYGWMSLVGCHCVGVSGKVVAFEPSPPLVEFLQYNRKANRFRQMEIVPKAVADSDDHMVPFYLVHRGDSFLNSLIDHRRESKASETEQRSTIQVQTITLDQFSQMTDMHPDAVKIDVEGAELLVLQGCRRLLKKGRTAFIVAVHPTWLPEGHKATELFELFRVHGYKVAATQCVQYDGADFGDYLFVPSYFTAHTRL
jgi:FkbM family methyltransferase